MFTGIIEERGRVLKLEMQGPSAKLKIAAFRVLEGTKIGDSIAVNGVCLTVTAMESDWFTADVMAETLRRSSLGNLSSGSSVNLERAMAADGRFGGHFVSGHIDGTGTILKTVADGNATWVYVSARPEILRLIVEKGSVALDGISLTVAKVTSADFAVSIIPHTGEETTLLTKKTGDIINIENDLIGKYVQKLMTAACSGVGSSADKSDGITEEFLRSRGF